MNHDEIEEEDLFAPKKKKVKRPKYYISNEDMAKELKIYYDDGEFTETLAQYFMKIVEGIAHAPNFINFTWIDEMRSDAIERMCLAVHNKSYDITRTDKAFSYFTMIAWRAFQNRIKIEKKQIQTTEDFREKIYDEFQLDHNFDLTQEQKNWD